MDIKMQRGLTLVEVLISIVILGVGLLGLAGLHSLSLRLTQNSYLIAVATQQAQDMAERMRANPQGIEDGDYNALSGLAPTPSKNCDTSVCIATERKAYDHRIWSDANKDFFGVGDEGTVTLDNATGAFHITLNWTELNSDGVSQSKNYTLVFFP